ncbi:MAG: lytic transglycosylase domain-containing protein [Pseudolabrys sp.]
MRTVLIAFLLLIAAAAPSRAEDAPRQSLCLMLESAAAANKLPLAFLVRVIWRESRFDPNAVGPKTRSGARAEGIAQFMPRTAAERDLADPYDPVQALPKAAAYLAALRDEFGNLGLAAAAYNAGPARVHGWIEGTRTMPAETRAYVDAVTSRTVDDWKSAGVVDIVAPQENCETLVASLKSGPGRFFYDLEQRVATAIGKPWGIELAAGFSRARVLAAYARLMDRLSALVGTHDPIVTGHVQRSRGTRPLYQARIGAETRQAADDICKRIRRAGEACVVMRNRG